MMRATAERMRALRLLREDALADGGGVMIPAVLAIVQRGPRQGENVLPERIGKAGPREFFADFLRDDVALPFGATDDLVGD